MDFATFFGDNPLIPILGWSLFLALLIWLLARFRYGQSSRMHLAMSNEVVLITGCDSGIGFQLAKHFDRLGFVVYAGCLDPGGSGPEELRSESSSRLRVLDLDITDAGKVARAYDELNVHLHDKGIWCLINNAGVLRYGELEWLTWDQCQKQVDVNLVGTMRMTKTFLPLVIKRRGRIVTATSINGLLAYPLQSVYCATKFALEGFCDSLRVEIERHGVHISCVELGDFARLTAIMVNHDVEARIMRESMDKVTLDRDRRHFELVQEMIRRHCGLTSPKSYKDSPLFETFEHAVLAPRPQNRYMCLSLKQRIFFSVLLSLPRSVPDAFVSFVYRKIMNNY